MASSQSSIASTVLTEICSAVEYLLDRGEIDHLTEVETQVRYTPTVISEMIVVADGRRVRITAQEIP